MNQLDFIKKLEEYKKIIWPVVERNVEKLVEFDKEISLKSKYETIAKYHLDICNDYPQRKGKYFRPSLVMLCGMAMGATKDELIDTAAAMQLSEEWILVHDDIEDDSEQRRGKPTLHKICGKNLAINAGDSLQIAMWNLIKRDDLRSEFYQMLKRTTLGQTIEIKWTEDRKKDLTDEDILLIMESKTGYYTIGGPLRLGAIIAGANKEQLAKLYEFGKLTGYCFQIRDDVLDITSNFGGLKKQGNDG
jgi:geranylgeranyl diphosphate synthase type II